MKSKTFVLLKLIVFFSLLLPVKLLFSQELIHEGFDNGIIPPDGWTINVGGTYTSASGSGQDIPSLKFAATGQYVETPWFLNPDSLSFWIKGYSPDSISVLVVKEMIDSVWVNLDSLVNLPRSEMIRKYSLNSKTEKLRFNYYKSKGNLAFDDVVVTRKSSGTDTLPPVFMNGTPAINKILDTYAEAGLQINESGTVYFVVLPSWSDEPSVDQIINLSGFDTVHLITAGSVDLTASSYKSIILGGQHVNTNYSAYFVAADKINPRNVQKVPIRLNFTTVMINKDLYFSEIIEGSSNNKALEIYNPSTDSILLDNYRIAMSSNGSGWKTTYHNFPKGAKLAPNDVWVILRSSSDSSKFDFSVADEINSSTLMVFTGNDARGLQKTINGGTTWNFIDIFGDPTSAVNFDVAGIKGAASNHTLIRKPDVCHGNTDWQQSAGTSAENSEWLVYNTDYSKNLGYPSVNPCHDANILSFELSCQQNISINPLLHTINVTAVYGTQVDNLVPKITVSPGATIIPALGDTIDFSEPVVYTVIAEDGINQMKWIVKITIAKQKNSQHNIIEFSLPEEIKPALIDTINHTVTSIVRNDADVTKLFPSVTLSAGAIISPNPDLIYDFTLPQKFIITAQNGDTCIWTVYIIKDTLTRIQKILASSYRQLQVMPNPTNGLVQIIIPEDILYEQVLIEVYSVNGNILKSKTTSGKNNFSINLGGLPKCCCVLKIKTSVRTYTKVIVIQ